MEECHAKESRMKKFLVTRLTAVGRFGRLGVTAKQSVDLDSKFGFVNVTLALFLVDGRRGESGRYVMHRVVLAFRAASVTVLHRHRNMVVHLALDSLQNRENALQHRSLMVQSALDRLKRYVTVTPVLNARNQSRVRTCTNPKPQFGGPPCEGFAEERRDCDDSLYCKIDGAWGSWLHWEKCDAKCGLGMKRRFRMCDSPMPQNGGAPCFGYDAEELSCDTGISCDRIGGMGHWMAWSKCSVSCDNGVQIRERLCNNPPPSSPDLGCLGTAIDERPCSLQVNCPVNGGWSPWDPYGKCIADCSQDWSLWTKWSMCSAKCGPGVQERTRYCVDRTDGQPDNNCIGDVREVVQCQIVSCPTSPLNCSTECKWDNGIGYASYPGECSLFVQCDSLYGTPKIQKCPWGLLWSLEMLQCVFPHQSECMCEFKESSLGGKWYEQKIGSVWTPRPCGDGTIYSHENCGCIYFYDGISQKDTVCEPDLLLTFDTLRKDIKRNVGLRVENVTYLGDGTAHFDGTAAINDNIFSNAEWGTDVYMYIKFKPEGKGQKQGLLHNSGCGPSDIGPSVFVGIDRDHELYGAGNMNMKFAAVPIKTEFEYDFVNITVPRRPSLVGTEH
ncbi:CADN-like protein [Mya arenaria]|uniref:CADN-like protein n=1 Tax=Mya arenaria TaxID=6604 RepID=A0ABY7DYV6_MYAAR|nr:CADN-like protein [Mya arenaria]